MGAGPPAQGSEWATTPSFTVTLPVPRSWCLPALLSQTPAPSVNVAASPCAVPSVTVRFTQSVQAGSIPTPGTVVHAPPSGA